MSVVWDGITSWQVLHEDHAARRHALADAAKVSIQGGHHFDGDYEALAERLLNAILKGPQAAVAAPVAAPTAPAQ